MLRHRRTSRHISFAIAVALIAAALGVGYAANALQSATGSAASDEHARRGEVYAGLQRSPTGGACRGAYEARTADGKINCSHGPDPAPDDVDVRRHRSTEELAAGTTGSESTGAAGLLLPCYGDGMSGQRIQAIYARSSGVADRYASIAGLIAQWAAKTDAVFANSAAVSGGVRHVRFVTSACSLVVANVVLSATGDDNISNTINELKAKGYNRTDRKYLIWSDANVYCGIGTLKDDDRATSDNTNNVGPSYARVDSGCWGSSYPVEAHEMMHNIGGLQLSAAHSSGNYHCTDESDRMCYPDAAGVTMTYPCPSQNEALFDCGHDDYFDTTPAAGSYLATHWNTANSVYLSAANPDSWTDTTTSPSPTSTPVPTAAPAPTPVPTATPTSAPTPTPTPSVVSTTYTDSLNKKITTRSYTVTSGAGALSANATFTRASSLVVRIRNQSGTVLAERTGASPAATSATVPTGTYIVEVSGRPASFTLTVSRPAT